MEPVVLEPKLETSDGWTTIKCDDVSAFSEWLDTDGEALPFRPGEHPSLGSHLLIEFYDCEQTSLESELVVGRAMRDAAKNSEATVVDESFHEFKPYGVSGAVIIQESHYTIHTWPEHGYAAIDLFYCGGTVRVQKALDTLKERFRPGRIKFLVVRRGVQDEVQR
ncbi:adenosylmethionine decarboxylase [bacterium]|nr:MAG: adenosylmethionine decarboxylase [bacterium]